MDKTLAFSNPLYEATFVATFLTTGRGDRVVRRLQELHNGRPQRLVPRPLRAVQGRAQISSSNLCNGKIWRRFVA